MQSTYNSEQWTVVQTDISPTEMVADKQYKTKMTKIIISNTCALLNSGGGKFVLNFQDPTPCPKHIHDCVRMVEQWVIQFVGPATMSSNIQLEQLPNKILLHIKGNSHLSTVNYNLYLPTHAQVTAVASTDPVGKVKEILERKSCICTSNISQGSHQTTFVQGEDSGLIESYSVQFKQLKSTPSKCIALADRMTGKGTKLTCYVSAFANYCGGHIYYGISDDGKVRGEKITEKDKIDIIKKVSKTISHMTWLGYSGEPRKGKEWDIYFEPVMGTEGNRIPSTFVIIITVVWCLGGVFTFEPESYHVTEGTVKKMSLETWKENLLSKEVPKETKDQVECNSKTNVEVEVSTKTPAEISCALRTQCKYEAPHSIARCTWSSNQTKKNYCFVNGNLIRIINDGNWKQFERRAKIEESKCSDGGVKLVILSMRITAQYKKNKFKKAEHSLKEYNKHLNDSKDRIICEVREKLVRSCLERCKGNHEKSYEIACTGLALVEQIPSGIIVGEYYVNLATISTILLSQERESERQSILKDEAMFFFKEALQHLRDANEYLPSKIDQEQKVHINLALLNLGCSFSGDAIEETVDDDHIARAVSSIKVVDQHIYDGNALSDYRECQYLFVLSMLHYRRSQNIGDDEPRDKRLKLLENALKSSKKAEKIALECNFEEMLIYSRKHKAVYTEMMVRHTISQ